MLYSYSFLKALIVWEYTYIDGHLPSKVVFHWRSSSIEVCLPSKVVFHWRSSSIKGRLPSKVVFHQRSYSIEGRIPSKVVFHLRSSFWYQLLLSQPSLKLTVTGRRTGRQKKKATYRGSSYHSTLPKIFTTKKCDKNFANKNISQRKVWSQFMIILKVK